MGNNPFLPEHVERFVTDTVTRELPVQKRLREGTSSMPQHGMQISPDEAAFLAMLVRISNARNILEIGTFTGYSALAMAMALPDGGKLVACDISKGWTDIGRRYWREAGIEHKIDLRLGQAQESLSGLIAEGKADSFDLAFIDADKVNYNNYYEFCLKLVRPGGVIALDNMLWGGEVADPTLRDTETDALRDLNLKIHSDNRVDSSFLTIADGIMLVRRRQ